MARAATTTDVFNAVAEPRRRAIIDLLAWHGPLAVGAITAATGLAQPAVSKHLGVLREVGLVTVERLGQRRIYALRAQELKVMHDWVVQHERLWTNQLERIRQRAERVQRQSKRDVRPSGA